MTAPTQPVAGDTITPGVRAYYDDWRSRMHEAGVGQTLPAFDDLDYHARCAWTHCYAAAAEFSVAMAEAVSETMGERP
jgi:hypothetical protein